MINIRRIQVADVSAIKAVADVNRGELGFNPRKKFEEVASQRRGFVAFEDEVILGFVIFRHRKIDRQTTLSEICIQKAYRRQHIGKQLVAALVKESTQMSREFIQLKCPVDLPANQFYRCLGFILYNVETGKKRDLNVWRFVIQPKPQNEI
jgi:ribosomal protein S18 acetylase RimI-like enzyme